ncbi:MAG TPA: hypothetical protein VF183_03195 [Acidimicrobiales bacterium]
MSPTVVALTIVALLVAGWMRFLGRRAAAGALTHSGPGIRMPATKVCEHTWKAAQRAAAPRYTQLAAALLGVAVVAFALDAAGVDESAVVVTWFVLAIGAQVVMLVAAGRAATAAAGLVRCEHQAPPKQRGAARRPRGARARGGRRRR